MLNVMRKRNVMRRERGLGGLATVGGGGGERGREAACNVPPIL